VQVEQVVNCGLQICAVLEHLHARGRLYCDMKPANVMLTAEKEGEEVRVILVDAGGVRRMDDLAGPQVSTESFLADRKEPPSVRRDLYQVGMTLHLLAEIAVDDVPGDDLSAVEPSGAASFRRLLDRARAHDPYQRFGSAAELAEQLRGVRQELMAERTGQPQPRAWRLFAPTPVLIDGGLGTPPALDRWTAAAGPDAVPTGTGRPTAAKVATGLPTPRVDPADPAADLLARTIAPDPQRMLDKLAAHREAVPTSAAVEWAACRANLERGLERGTELGLASGMDPGLLAEARACVDRAGPGRPADWRAAWHQGLIGLAAGDLAVAEAEFETVRALLPGESAPQLALACTAEQRGRREVAERFYQAVWNREHTEASAAFGLARAALERADRPAAARILDEVPEVSRHVDAARVAAVRASAARLPGEDGLPADGDFEEAERRLPTLVYLDPGSRNRLVASLREVALARAAGGAGRPAAEHRARAELETAYRALARQAGTAEDHGVLVDRANAVRPRTWR
jgi:serine/threonine-protein kinase PknG